MRDLATGEEHSFDPRSGERCNLLSFGATDDRVVLGQYCGTYDGGVRDDRVQILTTDGDQVVTLQDSGIDGALAGPAGRRRCHRDRLRSEDRRGTYVYDLGTDRFLRLSDAVSSGRRRADPRRPVPLGHAGQRPPRRHPVAGSSPRGLSPAQGCGQGRDLTGPYAQG